MLRTAKRFCAPIAILVLFAWTGQTLAEEDKQPTEQAKAVIPVFTLNRAVLESPAAQDPFFGSLGAESLKDLVARFEKARDDDEVAAVVENVDVEMPFISNFSPLEFSSWL